MHFPCTTIRWVFSYRERHFGFSVNEKYTLSSALRSPRVPSGHSKLFSYRGEKKSIKLPRATRLNRQEGCFYGRGWFFSKLSPTTYSRFYSIYHVTALLYMRLIPLRFDNNLSQFLKEKISEVAFLKINFSLFFLIINKALCNCTIYFKI